MMRFYLFLVLIFILNDFRFISRQFGLSLRDSIDNWNKFTNRWLRFVVYERTSRGKTFLTYALSAIWHGFYPGKYFFFWCSHLIKINESSEIIIMCINLFRLLHHVSRWCPLHAGFSLCSPLSPPLFLKESNNKGLLRPAYFHDNARGDGLSDVQLCPP